MNIAIVGSRTFTDQAAVDSVMDQLALAMRIGLVVSGGARGADSLGAHWARSRNIPVSIHYPDWNRFGRSAGFRRNETIITDADLVVAFWDGLSRGTAHSIQLARSQGKKVLIHP